MKRRVALVTTLAFLVAGVVSSVSAAQADVIDSTVSTDVADCSFEGPPQIEVLVEPPVVDPVVDRPSMVALTGRSGVVGDLRRSATVGQTAATPSYAITLGAQTVALAAGGFCARPAVLLSLRLSRIVVSLAREIPDSSCSRSQILDHEHEHVMVFVDGLVPAGASLYAGLVERLRDATAKVEREPDAPALFAARVSVAAEAAFADAVAPIDAANARLDNDPTRVEEGPSCGDELGAIIVAAERDRRRAAWARAREPRHP